MNDSEAILIIGELELLCDVHLYTTQKSKNLSNNDRYISFKLKPAHDKYKNLTLEAIENKAKEYIAELEKMEQGNSDVYLNKICGPFKRFLTKKQF